MKCLWCGEELLYMIGRGWLHPDGQLYKQKYDPESGRMVDDHCALPVRSKEGGVGDAEKDLPESV